MTSYSRVSSASPIWAVLTSPDLHIFSKYYLNVVRYRPTRIMHVPYGTGDIDGVEAANAPVFVQYTVHLVTSCIEAKDSPTTKVVM